MIKLSLFLENPFYSLKKITERMKLLQEFIRNPKVLIFDERIKITLYNQKNHEILEWRTCKQANNENEQ